jgi:hypothetical protein
VKDKDENAFHQHFEGIYNQHRRLVEAGALQEANL